MPVAKPHSLPAQERLKSRKLIEQLFRQGKSFSFSFFRIFYQFTDVVPAAGRPPVLFGVGVSSRNFKRAVDRNRVKRLMRESYRLQKQVLYQKPSSRQLAIFLIYTGKDIPVYAAVYEKLGLILEKLDVIIDKTIPPAA